MSATSPLKRITILCLVCVYCLVLIGATVRISGSGMGCPDWPTCFGRLIPPTSVEELPENYKTLYSKDRQERNKAFAGYLNGIGFESSAERILMDKEILVEPTFDPVKTYIEYTNRWAGVLTGFSIILLVLAALRYHMNNFRIIFPALATLVIVIAQGWIGSFVVSTKLLPWTVTIHLMPTFLILMLLMQLLKTQQSALIVGKVAFYCLCASAVMLIIQIMLGIMVRQSMDIVNGSNDYSLLFVAHRSVSWLVLLLNIIASRLLMKRAGTRVAGLLILLFTFLSIITGAIHIYSKLSKLVQPIHLLTATMLFGLLYYIVVNNDIVESTQTKNLMNRHA